MKSKLRNLYLPTDEILAQHGLTGLTGITGAEGGQGGFVTRSDAIETVPGTAVTADGQPLSEIWNELLQRTALYNQHVSAMLALMTFQVTQDRERVAMYTTARMEEATEFGRPQKVRLTYVRRAFPLDHADLGFGYTQEFLDEASGDEIRSIQAMAESAWEAYQIRKVLEAVFTESNATDEDGLVIKRLYNGDGEVPPVYRRWTHDGTHTHYLVGGASSFTQTNFETIEEHLVHHGYGDNGETLVIHVHRDDMVDVRGFTGFVPATTSVVPVVVDGQIIGSRPQVNLPGGLQPQGYVGRLVVVENNEIPSGYVYAHATGGLFAAQNPVGLRRHRNPSARGLRLIEGPNGRYPLIDAVYDGYAGAGVRHRGGAVVMQATDGSYSTPTLL